MNPFFVQIEQLHALVAVRSSAARNLTRPQ
jgi:hypothetical protein